MEPHKLLFHQDPVIHGRLIFGPRDSSDAQQYSAMKSQGSSIVPTTAFRDALHARVHLMSHAPLHVHGREYHWAIVRLSDVEPKYLRINPITNELETTSLLDSTARLLVNVRPTDLGS
jgi:hypothetical protein